MNDKINLNSAAFAMIQNLPLSLNNAKQPSEVYFFFGRGNDVLCINKESKKIECQIDDINQMSIAFTSATDVTIQTKNGNPLYLRVGSARKEMTSGGQSVAGQTAPQTASQTQVRGEQPADVLEKDEPILTVDSKEYPSVAMCQQCKNGKRCGSYDALKGNKFGDKGRALTSPDDLSEYENYCYAKIQEFNCHL